MSADGKSITDKKLEARLEALKLIKDWSNVLLVIQSAAIGVIGTLVEKHTPTGSKLFLVIGLFCTLIASIYLGAVCVLGTIPFIVAHLPENAENDIYELRGGLSPWNGRSRKTLGWFCIWQANLFVLSLVLFALFVVL